jgi:hypothetical protein
VKTIHKEKLQQALPQYCKQIGIRADEIPTVVFDPKEFQRRVESNSSKIRSDDLGLVNYKSRTILVNQNARGPIWRYELNNKGNRIERRINGEIYRKRKKVKLDYNEYRRTLVHELVHYRWHYLQHGEKFDKREWEILHAKVFPEKRLYNDITPPINNKIPEPAIATTIATGEANHQMLMSDFIT